MPSGIPGPLATALSSGVQQSSASISGGLAKVILVASDGVTPLAGVGGGVLTAQSQTLDFNLLPSTPRTTLASASPASQVSGKGLVLALTVSAAPNTSETLQLRWYPIVNANENVLGATGIFLASFTTALGSSMQTGGPWVFFLWLYPGATATPDETAHHKMYSLPTTRLWTAEVKPSGANAWTYAVDYGALQ